MAAVVDNRTPNYNIPLPNAGNWLSEDVIRLAQAITAFDQLIKTANDNVAGRALIEHAHQISEITGLTEVLAQKAAYDHIHALAALSDVDVSIITVGQYLRWNGSKWVPGVVSADDIKAGVMDPARLPSIAITDTYVVASQAQMRALDVQKGDIAVRQDLNRSFILSGTNPSLLASWTELLTPTDAVLSVAGLTGAITAAALRTAIATATGIAVMTAADPLSARQALGIVDNRFLAVGDVLPALRSAGPRPGTLRMNGALVSRSTYADLYAFAVAEGLVATEAQWTAGASGIFGAGNGSTTFRLPDWRGEFVRGWDDARGIDAGRAFGQRQGQSTESHKHKLPSGFDGTNVYWWQDSEGYPVYGSEVITGTGHIRYTTSPTGGPIRQAYTSVPFEQSGETRPRNVTALWCIVF